MGFQLIQFQNEQYHYWNINNVSTFKIFREGHTKVIEQAKSCSTLKLDQNEDVNEADLNIDSVISLDITQTPGKSYIFGLISKIVQ